MLVKAGLSSIITHTPTNKQFSKSSGRVGKVHFVVENEVYYTNDINIVDIEIESCKKATPIWGTFLNPPQVGEIIVLEYIDKKPYYYPPLSFNKPINNKDVEIGGRFGNFIRFGEDNIVINNKNNWIELRNDKLDIKSNELNVNSDVVNFNLNKEINILSKKNINILSNNNIVINSNKILLGKKADEPVLLGAKTLNMIGRTFREIYEFCNSLSVAKSTPEGVLLVDINSAASKLMSILENEIKNLKNLQSSQVYVSS